MRKIAVVTGSRAEFGILRPLIKEIDDSSDLDLRLFVTGLHLLDSYGMTVKDIKRDGLKIESTVEMYSSNERDPEYHGKGLAKGIHNFTSLLNTVNPDLLIVLGDRLEELAAILAAATLVIPIAHIHGGDKTDSGHIDESIRHSISKFAHVHFTVSQFSSERLLKMGEEDWRVYQVGAPGLDTILNKQPINKETLAKKLDLDLGKDTFVCIFHPVIIEQDAMGQQMSEVLDALQEINKQTVIIYPNNDSGAGEIIEEIEKRTYVNTFRIFKNLPHLEYFSLLRYAKALVGNSSSGIIEAPSLRLPVINIGSRNVGRDHGENVIFVDANRDEIKKAIKKVLNDIKFKRKVANCSSPYGDGNASKRIVKVLREIEINGTLLRKQITY